MSLGRAQRVKNLSAIQETWVPCLGWEDPLGEGMATHSSILAWRFPMDRGVWRATVHGVTKNRTRLSDQAQHSTLLVLCPLRDGESDPGVTQEVSGRVQMRPQTLGTLYFLTLMLF